MKRTKIICTLGPKSNSEKVITKLIKNGMNVARINMSHGDYKSHQNIIDNVKKVRNTLKTSLAILIDTKGPELRIGEFENGYVELKEKQIFYFTTQVVLGNENIVSVSYKNLTKCLKINDKIYANNGMLAFKVLEIDGDKIKTKVLFNGKLSNRKSLNIPNVVPTTSYLSDADKNDLLFAIRNNCEYIAASFVSNKQNILDLRKFLDNNNGKDIKIIAKIENNAGVKNIEEIINNCDGIMIARGDLGVEISLTKIPAIQKKIISLCNKHSKIVIVATEMLESMINSIRPTRAEVSDVANSIFDLTSATMLSGETAVGKYPHIATKYMKDIIMEAEKSCKKDYNCIVHSQMDNKAKTLLDNTKKIKFKNLAVVVENDNLIKSLAKFHNNINIYAITDNEKLFNSLSLYYNITPILFENHNQEELIKYIKNIFKNNNFIIYFEKNNKEIKINN